MQEVMNEQNLPEATKTLLKVELKEEENKGDDYEYSEEYQEENEDEDEDGGDFSFSLAFDGVDTSQISAEDVFINGQIKPIFPLFDHDLLSAEDFENLKLNDHLPNVKKVFIETDHDVNDLPATPSTSGDDDIVGPVCEWRGKAVVAAPEGCKKSNSTGFSKIWRFRDFVHRSNSDGRDAFVFLNHAPPSRSTTVTKGGKKEDKVAASVEKKEALPGKKVNSGEGRVNGNAVGGQLKVKKGGKGKTVRLSAHEIYIRSKSKDDDRRRSYLPYRPELVGFFTNVNGGGLTRNVNPF